MKQDFKCILLICAIVFLFNACDKSIVEPTLITNESVTFNGTISNTRVTNNEWDVGDAIGIFAINSGGTIKDDLYDNKDNIKFVTSDGSGSFSAASKKIYFPVEGSLDFIAYYPFQDNIENNKIDIDVSDQNDLSKIDFLYSNNATEISNEDSETNLRFKHMLSMVTLNIQAGVEIKSLEGIKAEIKNVTANGSFCLETEEFIVEDTPKINIIPNLNISNDNKTATTTSILIPSGNIKDHTIVFTIGSSKIEWQPSENDLKSGRHYIYKISISHTKATDIHSSVIEDWEKVELEEEEIIGKPGDSDDEEEGEEGEEGEDDEIGELLFPGSDFENEEDFQGSIIAIMDENIKIEKNSGRGSGNALKVVGGIDSYLRAFEARVDPTKFLKPNSRITLYIKGKSSNGFHIRINTLINGTERHRRLYTINDKTKYQEIKGDNQPHKNEPLDTNNKWIKVTLNIADIPDVEKGERDIFAVALHDYGETEILIDDIRIY